MPCQFNLAVQGVTFKASTIISDVLVGLDALMQMHSVANHTRELGFLALLLRFHTSYSTWQSQVAAFTESSWSQGTIPKRSDTPHVQ